jgi:mRNA interferase RelE/StbE
LAWRVEVTPAAAKELRKLNRQVARRIGDYLQDLVCTCGDPRQRGKGLTANMAGLWRYRVGDHRVICQLEDDRLLVLVVRVAHRGEAYR